MGQNITVTIVGREMTSQSGMACVAEQGASVQAFHNEHMAQANKWKPHIALATGGWEHPETGDLWSGQLRNDVPTGKGEYVFADSQLRVVACISGETKASLVFGGEGSMTWPDNSTYTGELVESAFHGHGTFKWANGDVYCGEWERAKRHGTGKFTSFQGALDLPSGKRAHSVSYSGGWAGDFMHGKGCIKFLSKPLPAAATGDAPKKRKLRQFQGQFKNGFPTEGSLQAGPGEALFFLASACACTDLTY